MERLDLVQAAELVAVAPVEEARHGAVIGRAGVPVADGGGEEFYEAARGLVAAGNLRREGQGLQIGPRARGSRVVDQAGRFCPGDCLKRRSPRKPKAQPLSMNAGQTQNLSSRYRLRPPFNIQLDEDILYIRLHRFRSDG